MVELILRFVTLFNEIDLSGCKKKTIFAAEMFSRSIEHLKTVVQLGITKSHNKVSRRKAQ